MIPSDKYEDGIIRCEVNALSSLNEAQKLIKQGDFRQAYIFGILALEEIGKAGFIIDKMDQLHISKKEWKKEKTFMDHVAKIMKVKDIYLDDFILEINKVKPNFLNGTTMLGVLGWSDGEIKERWDYRNRMLFVDYDFNNDKWESPQDIQDMEKRANEIVDDVITGFMALESTLLTMKITPLWKRIL